MGSEYDAHLTSKAILARHDFFFFFDINDLPLIEKIISLETKPSTHFPLTNQSWDTFEHARKLWIEGSVGSKGELTTMD